MVVVCVVYGYMKGLENVFFFFLFVFFSNQRILSARKVTLGIRVFFFTYIPTLVSYLKNHISRTMLQSTVSAFLLLAGLAVAAPATTTTKCESKILCVDGINECGIRFGE